MLDNFVFGLQALAGSMRLTLIALAHHYLIWGFGLGFAAATMLQGFLATSNPRHLPNILFQSPSDAFPKIYPLGPEGYARSYSEFQHEYNYVRTAFFSATAFFLAVVVVALLKY